MHFSRGASRSGFFFLNTTFALSFGVLPRALYIDYKKYTNPPYSCHVFHLYATLNNSGLSFPGWSESENVFISYTVIYTDTAECTAISCV